MTAAICGCILIAVAAYAIRIFKPSTAAVDQVQALVQRCSVQMLKDTCRVMNAPTSSAGARLFVAGIGEVDAAAFASIRSFGDKMCQAIGSDCVSDWEGARCRIPRTLYPPQAN